MSFEIKTVTTKSSDNSHTLVGKVFIPNGEIKGLFQIVHGMTEHIDRYEHLMSYLAENGYLAFGFDNLGHGKTAENESELGFIAHKDGWKFLVDDVNLFAQKIKNEYPEKPFILMGHSMGSFIVRLVAEYYPNLFDKLIICGTGGKNPLASIGLTLTKIIVSIKGEKHISSFVYNMAFGDYNKRFSEDSKRAWLTKDKDIIKKYDNDKFCNFSFTVSAMHDLIKLNYLCNRDNWYNKIDKKREILLIAGDMDPVGDYGKGVTSVYDKLSKADANATLKLYKNCRHEIHNDSCKDEMFSDILNFIK